MATLMLGAAATTTTAATAGLFGVGGTFALGTALSTVGTVVSAASAITQGRSERQAAHYQAVVQQQQAERERVASKQEEREFRERHQRLFAAGRARRGATGFTAAGTPLLLEEDMAAEAELQALKIGAGGEVRATRLEQQAQITRHTGRQMQTAGFTRAGASLLSGFGQIWGNN